jgi:hypothetical protein
MWDLSFDHDDAGLSCTTSKLLRFFRVHDCWMAGLRVCSFEREQKWTNNDLLILITSLSFPQYTSTVYRYETNLTMVSSTGRRQGLSENSNIISRRPFASCNAHSSLGNNRVFPSSNDPAYVHGKNKSTLVKYRDEGSGVDENSNMSMVNSRPPFHPPNKPCWKTATSKASSKACNAISGKETIKDDANPILVDRISGEGALSTQAYKDVALRRAVYEHIQATKTLQNMLQFQDKPLNKHMPTGTLVSVICDPIIEQPQLPGLWDYQRRRHRPLRMAVASSREAFDQWLDDLVAHRDDVIVTSDSFEIDKGIFGERPSNHDEFLRKGTKK